MIESQPTAALDGRVMIALALLASCVSTWLLGLGLVSALCWGALVLAVVLWRTRPRDVPSDPGAVLSPADGRVVSIGRVRDPYTNREALLISVFMNVLGTPAHRACVDGVVRHVRRMPGLREASASDVSAQPASNAVVIDAHGRTVTLVQVAGRIARRVLCHVKPGDVLTRGQRFGQNRFGSRIDMYLPIDALPLVALGDRVLATTTIVATLPKA
ncbi:MAG TPA: phosphatidylserine decarboxylase [Aquabacterium sp.]|uniref:phosphatidylserine decarboxylase n=1 Tax=Aquabacterium sp. TaxID=1872578 RepID=UPI002D906079|nr:phosphatidylserine decarboxylase [Aquabacterium sp.]HET6786362.1 phosphatidylserine decarboxylase [Aquabacterium sp.]HEX5371176.1 phosphatidylserine decarboxylase [Aquabacterium sp.]